MSLEAPLMDLVFDADGGVLAEVRLAKDVEMWAHQAALRDRPVCQWRALGELHRRVEGSEAARVGILRLLVESPQPLLRERAALLSDFADPRAVPTLVRAATTDPVPRVRKAAVHALLQQTARDQFEPGGEEYEAFLGQLPVETSPAVRAAIERLLHLER